MNIKRTSRTLICLVLVCALLIGISPIQTKAFVLTATAATGVAATLFSMAMGVVFVDLTADLIEGIGENFSTSMVEWGEANDKSEAVSGWLDGFTIGWDEEDYDGVLSIPTDILSGAVDWAKGLINGEGVEVEEEVEATEGYAYYNGVLIPVIDSVWIDKQAFPYAVIDDSGDFLRLYSHSLYVSGMQVKPSDYITCNTYKLKDGVWQSLGTNLHYSTDSYCFTTASLPLWTNFNIYYEDGSLYFAGSSPVYVGSEITTVKPATYVGDIPTQVQDGTFEEEKYELPYINYSQIFQGQTDAVEALNNVATHLQDQTMTYAQYMELIQAEASTDNGDDDTVVVPVEGTLADTQAQIFFEKLVDVVTSPFEWLWSKTETFFGPWIESIQTWFSEVITNIQSIPDAFSGWFSDIITGVQTIPGTITDAFADVIAGVVALPKTITNAFTNVLTALFVPAEGYIDTKVEGLTSKYAFANAIADTGQQLGSWLSNLGQQPPIIYIDLGAARGSYDIGEKVVLMDLTWYSEYKPTVDKILSAFLWLWFVWRMMLSLPGIIQGASGFWNKEDSVAGSGIWERPAARLNPGSDSNLLGTSNYHSRGTGGRHYIKHDQ